MSEENHPQLEKEDIPYPIWVIIFIPFYIVGIFVALLMWIPTSISSANYWNWTGAWVLAISLAINLGIGYGIINNRNPRLLRNRSKMRKTGITDDTRASASSDKIILPILFSGMFGALILPIFDYHEKWSDMSIIWIIIGLVVFNIGVIIMNIAQLENSYASKVLDINKGQVLIDTGLYGIVRHPMYFGSLFMIIGIPFSLGSWVSIIPALVAIIALLVRINYEEEMLLAGMVGYGNYQKRVKYRILPKIY